MAMCFLPPLHSAESPLESRHRQRSTISEAGTRLSQATADSDLRQGLGALCPVGGKVNGAAAGRIVYPAMANFSKD